MRLSARLAVALGVVGFLTLASVAGAAWALSANEVRDSVDTELRQRLAPFQLIGERLARGDVAAGPTRPVERVDLGDGNRDIGEFGDRGPFAAVDGTVATADALIEEGAPAQFQFVFSDGSVAGTPDVEPTANALDSLADDDIHLETVEVGGVEFRVGTYPVDLSGFALTVADDGSQGRAPIAVQVYRDVRNEESALSSLALQLGALSLLGVSVVALASWLIGRWMAKPALTLAERAEHLAHLDDLPARVEIGRSDEFGRLAGSFNRMLSALEVGREQQRRLVADASHELRTPLTSLRMRIEYLRKHADADDVAMLDAAVHDTEHLSALVHDLVDLAADVRSADEEPVEVCLGDLVHEVAEQARVSTQRSIEVAADHTVVEIRPTMVRRAVRNLVDNAAKYAPEGPIRIRTADGAVAVHDEGPGIARDDRAFVFDRFFRSPKARARPGNGIGLAIVAQVAEAHGGRTWVAASPHGGAEVGFSVTA